MPIASGGFFRLVANEREAMSVVRQLRWANLGVALLALAAPSDSASIGSRFIIRPVLDLAENARNLSQGDLTQRADIGSSDEIGDLASAFNTMAANLERTVSQARSLAGATEVRRRNRRHRVRAPWPSASTSSAR